MVEHIGDRPSWDCRACGKPWPCDPAREQLAAELQATALRIHMWIRLEVAAGDMPNAPAGELFERFLHWTSIVPLPDVQQLRSRSRVASDVVGGDSEGDS